MTVFFDLKKICTLCLLFFSFALNAQRTENETVLRKIAHDHYFRISYDNDFIATDQYYTQGLNVEIVNSSFKKIFLNKLFFKIPHSKMRYGMALDHYGFTPIHYEVDSMENDDRPYAGCLSVSAFRMATNQQKKQQIVTTFTFGLIGPAAGGDPLQRGLHKWLKDPEPQGWKYQIRDVILNYKIGYEKNLLLSKFFLVNGNAQVRVGTLNNKLSSGLSAMIGKMHNPFSTEPITKKQRWQCYLSANSFGSFVAYDATMQGGFFISHDPCTLSAYKIKRFTTQAKIGMMLNYRWLYIEIAENFLSPEFKGATTHKWGTLNLGFQLK